MITLTDRQKLIYDLSMRAAMIHLQADGVHESVEGDLLDALSESISMYEHMAPGNIDEIMDALKKF